MDASGTVNLSAIPIPLEWSIRPEAWHVENSERLTITAPARTDLFTSPQGNPPMRSSPRLVFRPSGDFILKARVEVGFAGTYDAGVLVLYVDDSSWAKLCFELSPQRQPMVVSVVTRGFSDDCNSAVVDGNQVYLRVARLERERGEPGAAYAFHYSLDGRYWHMVRHFALEAPEKAVVGFSAQAPTGEGCTVTFSEIEYEERRLGDLRSGE